MTTCFKKSNNPLIVPMLTVFYWYNGTPNAMSIVVRLNEKNRTKLRYFKEMILTKCHYMMMNNLMEGEDLN